MDVRHFDDEEDGAIGTTSWNDGVDEDDEGFDTDGDDDDSDDDEDEDEI